MSNKVAQLIQVDERAHIVKRLREIADEYENGERDPVSVILVVDNKNMDDVDVITLGRRPRTSDAMGLLEFAKQALWNER